MDITVVTPTYNRAGLLPRVWESLRTQNADFEWIIVDDGSSDNTSVVIAAFDDPRITFITLPENRGTNVARNAGAQRAKGRYVVFLDSDDQLNPESLAIMVETMDGAGVEIGAAAFACVVADTGKTFSFPDDGKILTEYDVVCDNAFLAGDKILVYRRGIFQEFLLPEEVRGCEHVFVYEVSKKWSYLLKNRPLSVVHRQLDNLCSSSSMVARSFDMARSFEMVLENHSQVLEKCPKARFRFHAKALYRYLVAGARPEAWRVYKSIIRQQYSLPDLSMATLMILSGGFKLASFEKWRIDRINKKLTGR